ncbi:MAG TPA: signal peptide peptidase SppA, partial [Verrucomicrobiae bacterium]|nr:signal peptide peptidase SppA [Verrucomicrobiae bacterium]
MTKNLSSFSSIGGKGCSFRSAAVLWSVVLAFLLAGIAVPAAANEPAAQAKEKEKERDVVAVFRLEGHVTEVPAEESFALFGVPGTSLKELVSRLRKAAEDPAVKAVVILPDSVSLGLGQVEELRGAMSLVRSHGKKVYVHADSLMMGQYVLACGASHIGVSPTGVLLVPGLHGASLHVRGLLDKIGVKPDFLTEGAYKSAAELFMREQPSPESDEMMNWLLDSWYASFKDMIVQGRKADAGKVQGWLDNGLFTAEQAKADGLIDAVEQHHDFEAMLKKQYGQDVVFDKKYGRANELNVDFSSPFAFLKIWGDLLGGPKKKEAGKPVVGIVYVDGPIMTGKGSASPFGASQAAYSTEVREALEKAAADDSIKAVVLRVDSPGGSVTASEIILDATRRLKAKKPMVVSMGDVAGSGGYYVACAADTIFADATTLTGSIGVVAGKVATTEMWKKVGITFKEYNRGKNAGIFSTDNVFTESERARVRDFMEEAYTMFKNHVTEIRGNRLKKPIDELAGGRVYTGKQALELGLVDRLGTMSDAVAFAAGQANIKDYDTRVVPEPKNFLEQLMEQMNGDKEDGRHIGMATGGNSLFKLAA